MTLGEEAMRHCGRCSPAEKPRPPVKEVIQVRNLESQKHLHFSFFILLEVQKKTSYFENSLISLGILGEKNILYLCSIH